MSDESAMETYLATGKIGTSQITRLIREKGISLLFGSALRLEGIEGFMEALADYTSHLHILMPLGPRFSR